MGLPCSQACPAHSSILLLVLGSSPCLFPVSNPYVCWNRFWFATRPRVTMEAEESCHWSRVTLDHDELAGLLAVHRCVRSVALSSPARSSRRLRLSAAPIPPGM